jgi:hypothetical protein
MKDVEAIHHITEATLADDPKKAVEELDRAAELIDEMAASLAEEGNGEGESVREKVGKVGETVKDAAPPTPLVLAGLGILAGLAALGAVKALSGRGSE